MSHDRSSWGRRAAAVLLFSLGLLLLDRSFGFVMDEMFARSRTGQFSGHANYILEQRPEVFVFGSSRAVHHVDPAVLEGRLGCTVFNAALDGQGILYATSVQDLLYGRGAEPRYVLLQVGPKDLYAPAYDRLGVLAPYYGESRVVDGLLERRDRFARFKLHSRLYRYNSRAVAIAGSLVRGRAAAGNGFVPLSGNLEPADWPRPWPSELDGKDGGPDPEAAAPFRQFTRAARARDIPVFWFTGPRWRGNAEPLEVEALGEALLRVVAEEEGATFLDLDERALPQLAAAEWYRDPGHLNAAGAARFSEALADGLMPLVPPCHGSTGLSNPL